MKKKKYLLFFIILFISIGFAYLSTNLNITGSSLIKGNTWDVHFEDVQVTSGSVTATTPTISTDKKSVNYTVTLDMPGDYFEFTVDAVNDGTIDAMVDTVSNTGLTSDQLKYLDYSVELNNGDPLEHGYILLQGTRKTYKVRLEYKLDISEEDLPDSDQTISLTLTVNYLQTDENAYTTATFDTGSNVNKKMKSLSGQSSANYTTYNSSIKSIIRSNTLTITPTSDNVVSIIGSESPIYMWFVEDTEANDGTGDIYWYTDASYVKLNNNSSNMFYNIRSLESIDSISDWNTNDVTDLSYMFRYCVNLENNDIVNVSNWDVSNITNMSFMFYECSSITNLSALSSWNVNKVTNMSSMFSTCTNLNDITALSNWNVKNLTSMTAFLKSCTSLVNLAGLNNWNVKNITSLYQLFDSCTNLSNISALSNWKINNVTNLSRMFYSCTHISDLSPLTNWNVGNVENMYNMFYNCSGISSLNSLSEWNVGSVTKMGYMFRSCTNVTDLSPLSNWNVSNVTDMEGMFLNCTRLIDASGINNWTSKLNVNLDYTDMFGSYTTTLPSWYV